jgi:hypothetical protein
MNVATNHLMKIDEKELQEVMGLGYAPIPAELNQAANRKLAGQSEAYVSFNSGGKLSSWAAQKRKKKRKMAKESRKRNR